MIDRVFLEVSRNEYREGKAHCQMLYQKAATAIRVISVMERNMEIRLEGRERGDGGEMLVQSRVLSRLAFASDQSPNHISTILPRSGPMPDVSFTVNGRRQTVDVDADTPLLWVLRDTLDLKGTKFGCGIASCGACTVHLDGVATRTCVLPITAVEGKSVTTIEGLSSDRSHPVQEAWITEDVPQCGYCQSGQIMAAVALLEKNPSPSDEDIDNEMTNVCRCGTYQRIRAAIHRAARS